MKKTKSIFTRLLLLILPLVLAADAIILAVAYGLTHRSNLKQSMEQVEAASREVAQYLESVDLTRPEQAESAGRMLDRICHIVDLAYLYCAEANPSEGSIRYLALGYGEDAVPEARETHFPGLVLYDIEDPELFAAAKGSLSGNIREEFNQNGDMLISYTPVIRHNDNAAEEEIYDVIGAEMSITDITRAFRRRYFMIAAYMMMISVLIVLGILAVVFRKVSVPAREISRRMSEYVADREKMTHEEKLPVRGNDEFSRMAEAFNTMTEDIDRYIDHIEVMNREKLTAEAEMNIARDIQMGLLAPERMDSGRVSLRAYIQPARDVGGDLYDYCLLEDGRIFVAIADVSGKGVMASLYMCSAITLLHQYAVTGCSPARMLREYNNTLAAKNPRGLFITTFAAIYDPEAGELTYSNAGHNYPYILSEGLIPLKEAHGVAAGLFPEEEYEEAVISVPEGTLFLYTDGVSEAANAEGEFYSTGRLEEKLAVCLQRKEADPLQEVLEDVNRFVRGAVQSDDITMLSLSIRREPADSNIREG